MIRDLIERNRSCRRFHQDAKIELDTLRNLIDLARLSASAANLQPLKFILSNDAQKNTIIFKSIGWAGYLKNWSGPSEGERPSAYIIVLLDTSIANSAGCDHGIACQSILLGATDMGLGGCMIATIKKKALRDALEIPAHFEILLVVALGKPKEKIVIEDMGVKDEIKYWRDGEGVHHVPKRRLDDIIIPG
jgi:nitroreductase